MFFYYSTFKQFDKFESLSHCNSSCSIFKPAVPRHSFSNPRIFELAQSTGQWVSSQWWRLLDSQLYDFAGIILRISDFLMLCKMKIGSQIICAKVFIRIFIWYCSNNLFMARLILHCSGVDRNTLGCIIFVCGFLKCGWNKKHDYFPA